MINFAAYLVVCAHLAVRAVESPVPIAPAVGYQDFHPDVQINYQLNRCLTGGRLRDLREVAQRIRTFEDWKRELAAQGKKALEEGRTGNAAYYYRYSSFFCGPGDPYRLEAYERFVRLIGEEYRHTPLRRYRVPYGRGTLPALRMTPVRSRGTVLFTSGFDTYLEEYIPRMVYYYDAGYDVIAFNGPGQGEALVKRGMKMTHEWEKPVKAVLDHFALRDVTLVGVSLGGYLALRAAAFEPRVTRVVAFNVMYDFYGCFRSKIPRLAGAAVDTALDLHLDPLVDAFIGRRMRGDMLTDWFIRQGMTVTGTGSPAGFLREIRKYHLRDCSARITQDVLLLAGSEDHYVPLEQLYEQMRGLTRAKSVTGRVFTRREGAQNHGQYGYPGLAMGTILGWMQVLESRDRRGNQSR
jgi:pimeloyl-ACP methyl ester carboxylesterase